MGSTKQMDQMNTINNTDFNFPGQKGVYKGKVREVYNINDELLVMIASDRLSAFDVIMPRQIPYKGQILNQIASYMLEAPKIWFRTGYWLVRILTLP